MKEFIDQFGWYGGLPLQFKEGYDRKKLNITGAELITVVDIEKELNQELKLFVKLNIKMGQ